MRGNLDDAPGGARSHVGGTETAWQDRPSSGSRLLPFSVVIPAFDEEGAILRLAERLRRIAPDYIAEFLLIDDGSTDGTGRVALSCELFRCITRPHEGKTAALRAGFLAARYPVVVTLDADLQEDPAQIPDLVRALGGRDLVYGQRTGRADPYIAKVLPSRVYNWIVALLFGRDFGDINCGFRAMRRELALSMPTFEGAHRLYPLIVHLRGGVVDCVPVRHRRRETGHSKFASPLRFANAIYGLICVRAHSRVG